MNEARVFARTKDMLGQLPAQIQRVGDAGDYVEATRTNNFILSYQRTLGENGVAIANTLKGRCEADFAKLKGWFNAVPDRLPFKVFVDKDVPGAMHYGCAETQIYVGSEEGKSPGDQVYCLFLAAEVAEVLEATIGVNWNCGYSNGEALSRVLPGDIYPTTHAEELATAPRWLYETAPDGTQRRNWVDYIYPSDREPFSVGCSVLFLNWLRFELGKSWQDIIRKGGETLGETYKNVTGQSDGWETFKRLVNTRFPPGASPRVKTDNPFRPSASATV